MFAAIFYILTTGIQWKAIPRCLGAPSTVHDRFQEWAEAGLFERLWATGLVEFDASSSTPRLGSTGGGRPSMGL